MLYLDETYLKQISPRLERFKDKGDHLYVCRCPLCGDSQKSKRKARCYFYGYNDDINIKCHNCGASMSFGNFLKDYDPNLYERYCLERYKSKANPGWVVPVKTEPDFSVKVSDYLIGSITDGLKNINQLPEGHPAKVYVEGRKIPTKHWARIFYAPKFIEWAKTNTDHLDESKATDHPRLVLPWYHKDGGIDAYAARAFGNEEPKYYTIALTDRQRFYGWNLIDDSKPVYVLEGPIDTLFLDNAIAVGSASLGLYDFCEMDIYVPDRDVRNPHIMKIVEKLVKEGKKVCMLPEDTPGKDLNNLAELGWKKDEIKDLIDKNTYQGLAAQMHFTIWRKTK